MKKIILTLSILLSLSLHAQNIVWLDSMEVADGIYGYIRPRLALSKEGNPQVLMAKGGSGKLFFSQWQGTGFSTPISLSDSLDETYIANWTGPDMESFGDTIVAVFKLMPYDTGKVYTIRSTDGGQTFGSKQRVDSHSGGMVWMPSMNMDGNGNPIITYMAHDANYSNPHYVIVRSNDGGATYQNEEFVTGAVPGEACDCCPSEIATKNDQKILLYRNNENNVRDIYAVSTDAQGGNFLYNENVDGNAWSLQSCPSTGPHGIIEDDSLYTAFVTGVTGSYRVHISVSSLSDSVVRSSTYSLPEPSNPYGTQNFPRIAIENGLLVVAWTEAENSNFEIYTSWAPLSNLNELMNHKQMANSITNGVQTNPDVRLANGYIHLVYQDTYQARTIYRRGLIGYLNTEELSQVKQSWYPNPAAADKSIEVPANFVDKAFCIVDLTGKKLYKHQPGVKNMPPFQEGRYLIQVEKGPGISWVVKSVEN
ncbi:MAG: hypothetical protein N4A41_00210 [Crocinitomicaceae bacterium]|jgi:hypothetical protein|nr:hypothetical protein [Crocinitomicaceae bacterium]